MFCMKCGKETVGNDVFCEGCLETMRAYPVKPGTAVQLPRHKNVEEEKRASSRQRNRAPKDPMRKLHLTIRWLTAVIVVLSVLLCATAVMLIRTQDYENTIRQIQEWGKNYTAVIGN